MQRSLYKELWAMRFQKMLELERQGAADYQNLLKECQDKHKNQLEIQAHLKKLITDEKKHVKLVQELIDIVNRQKD